MHCSTLIITYGNNRTHCRSKGTGSTALANFYFLVVVIVEVIPEISPLSPLASILPLAVVLIVTAIKEGYEDLVCVCLKLTKQQRYKADTKVNHTESLVLKNGTFSRVKWKVSAQHFIVIM